METGLTWTSGSLGSGRGLTDGAGWPATPGATANWHPVTDTGIAPVHTFSVPVDGPKKFLRLTAVPGP